MLDGDGNGHWGDWREEWGGATVRYHTYSVQLAYSGVVSKGFHCTETSNAQIQSGMDILLCFVSLLRYVTQFAHDRFASTSTLHCTSTGIKTCTSKVAVNLDSDEQHPFQIL